MKLIFFDESKPSEAYPHYHIGAVCIDEMHLKKIEGEVSNISKKFLGTRQLTKGTEFHAAEIYHRKNVFKSWGDVNERLNVLEDLMRVLTLPEVRLIEIKINCALLSPKQSAEEIAFMFLCERANDFLKSQQSLGMLIGDRENDRLSERFSSILSGYKINGTEFAYGREIENLVDSVHFTHSHLSRFLQLADVYTWITQFKSRNACSKDEKHAAMLGLYKKEGVQIFSVKYKEWPKAK